MPNTKRTKIFVEAVPLVDRQMSGIPHAIAGLVDALKNNKTIKEKYEIVLVAPKSRLHLLDRWGDKLKGCTVKAIPMKFRIMNGLGRRGLLPPMDLLLGPGIYLFGNYFSWPLTRRSRSFTWIHDICFLTHPEFVQPDNQRMLEKNVPRYVRQSSYAVTVTETMRKQLIDALKVDPKKVVTIYNAAYDNVYERKYSKSEIEKVQRKYGLIGKKYFQFIGNIEPRKNLARLLKALMKLPTEYGLLMIGSDGWLNEEILELIEVARSKGRQIVRPEAYVNDDESARLMHGAVGFLWPSIDEGFGIPPLEGLAANKPTVTADIPQIREVTGNAAIYCNPLDQKTIDAALKRAISLSPVERKDLAKKGQARFKAFSWTKSAEKLAGLIDKAAVEIT